MDLRRVNLVGHASPVLDLDLTPSGRWVAVTGGEAPALSFAGRRVNLPAPCRFPMIRAMDEETIVLVDSRLDSEFGTNAWVIDETGDVLRTFRVGDAVEELLASPDRLVVLFFDEGALGGLPPSDEGVAVFDPSGRLEFGYQTLFGDEAVDVSDAYAGCWAGESEVVFMPYTDFPLVRLDVSRRRQEVLIAPPDIYFPTAITVLNGELFALVNDAIWRWSPERNQLSTVGRWVERLERDKGSVRGLRDGRFLSVTNSGYEVLSVRDEASG